MLAFLVSLTLLETPSPTCQGRGFEAAKRSSGDRVVLNVEGVEDGVEGEEALGRSRRRWSVPSRPLAGWCDTAARLFIFRS